MNAIRYIKAIVHFLFDCFTYPNEIKILSTTYALLGPTNICKYKYSYYNRIYTVILDHDIINFSTFKSYIQNSTLPKIPNRAVMSNHINIELFNEFQGPCCNFYFNCRGVIIPYSIDYFMKCQFFDIFVSLYDTYGKETTFQCMKKLNLSKWKYDCMDLKIRQ